MMRKAIPFLFTMAVLGCGKQAEPVASQTSKSAPVSKTTAGDHDDEGGHGAGPHGGTIIEFGRNHAELCIDPAKKTATVYLLDGKLKNAWPVKSPKLQLKLASPSVEIDLPAQPIESDPKGFSSRFVASNDRFAATAVLQGSVEGMIDGKPYAGDFKDLKVAQGNDRHADGPGHVAQTPSEIEEERKLYLTPGGKYTEADIKANGDIVSVKYKSFKASHDLRPKPGDRICPITLTKANDKLVWVIGGEKYTFCCIPCVEEFVQLAKTKPDEVKAPGEYVKK